MVLSEKKDVNLRYVRRKITIMKNYKQAKESNTVKYYPENNKDTFDMVSEYSPSWVISNVKEAPNYKLNLIDQIRIGVKKTDWKQLLYLTGSTEKEFETILPSSISSMQKNAVYNKETSERIYELARLFGLGYEVFDTKQDFKNWLMTPSKTLGNKVPFELLDSSIGFEVIENEIIRIQYNVYS